MGTDPRERQGTAAWFARLTPYPGQHRDLTGEDRSEAAAYASATARNRFLAARARLRLVLSACTGVPGAKLEFRRGRHGKPALAAERIHFNISHSRDRLLIAVSHAGPVGVDIEHMREIDAGWLARNWFSEREYREWTAMPASARHAAFFHGWTRKEAFIKATGLGLAMPLDQFSVSMDPARAELLEVQGQKPWPWRMTAIEAGPDCAAAMVTFGDPGRIAVQEIM
jgi:4'-phosphopantetheinyl transferase